MPVTPGRRLRDAAASDALRDEGRSQNEAKYTEFKLGCDANDPNACNSLGEWYALMRQDYDKAASLYTTGCLQHAHAQSCLNMGLLLATGRGGIPKSVPQATKLFAMGCRLGNADACAEAGRLVMLRGGGGDASDAEAAAPAPAPAAAPAAAPAQEAVQQAAALWRHGCSVGDGTTNAKNCGLLALLSLSHGAASPTAVSSSNSSSSSSSTSALPTSPAETLGLLHRACMGEHAPSCGKLAQAYRPDAPTTATAPPAAAAAAAAAAALRQRLGITAPDMKRAAEYEKQALVWSGMTERQAVRTLEKRYSSDIVAGAGAGAGTGAGAGAAAR